MKKSFLKLPNRAVCYTSRRFPQHTHSSVAYLTDAEIQKQQEELLGKIQQKIHDGLETRATKAELEDLKKSMPSDMFKDLPLEALRSLADDKNGAMALLTTQGLELQRIKTLLAGQPEDLSIRSQVKKWRDANADALKSISEGTKKDLAPLEIRLNSPMTPSNTYNGSAYLPKIEYAPGVNEIVRPQPTFWDYLKKGSTGAAAYVWINKKNPEGAAGFIGPGVAKPGISFEIATEISNAKKIAASEKVATELLQDVDGFASWIEQELTYQVMQKTSLTLMTGVASSTVPAGIQTLSTTYTLTTVSTTNPNNYDAIRACVAQLRSGNLVGNVTAFMNPIDYANMVMTKAVSQGQAFIPPATGATIVEDNNVPVGYLQIALLDYYKVLIYKGFTVTYGWENDDFTKNLVTVIGEMRIHQFFSENYTGAFIYDTFENIKTAITA